MDNLQEVRLAKSVVNEINKLHLEIVTLRQKAEETALEKAIRIGGLLEQEKGKLKHGQWLAWLSKNIEFSRASAERYRAIAQNYAEGKFRTGRNLSLRDAARKGTKGSKVIDVEATTESSSNGSAEAERGLKLGAPVEEQEAHDSTDDEPEMVIRRKIKACLEHYQYTIKIARDIKQYAKIAELPRKSLKRCIELCCLDSDEERKYLEQLLFS